MVDGLEQVRYTYTPRWGDSESTDPTRDQLAWVGTRPRGALLVRVKTQSALKTPCVMGRDGILGIVTERTHSFSPSINRKGNLPSALPVLGSLTSSSSTEPWGFA